MERERHHREGALRRRNTLQRFAARHERCSLRGSGFPPFRRARKCLRGPSGAGCDRRQKCWRVPVRRPAARRRRVRRVASPSPLVLWEGVGGEGLAETCCDVFRRACTCGRRPPASRPAVPRLTPYPWTSPQADLAAARALIERCGYGRRLEELADAEAIIGRAET
mgnify:CR=1 FL=1